jgi:tetratricopeptide (TPR) repeat protein
MKTFIVDMIRSNPDGGRRPFSFPIFILIGFYVAAGVIPIERLWGFNLLKYHYPVIAIFIAALAVALPFAKIIQTIGQTLDSIDRIWKRFPAIWKIVSTVIIPAVVFYLLRTKVHSLGDGYQRIYQIEKGFLFYHTEFLDFLLHAIFYRVANFFGPISGEAIYALFSVLCGGIFISVISIFKFPDGWAALQSKSLKLTIIFLGGSLLFFGYVESYSLYYPAAIIYILFGLRYLETGRGIIPTAIIASIIPLIHITGLFLFPSFLYLAWRPSNDNGRCGRLRRLAPFIFIAASFFALAAILMISGNRVVVGSPGFSGKILPFFSLAEYSVFSPEHLLDILNEILLIAPVSLIMLSYLVKSFKPQSYPLLPFLGIIGISSVLFLFLVDPRLGYANDWDLFATPAAALGISVAILFLRKERKSSGPPIEGLVAASVVFCGIWILTNSSAERQLARAEDLLAIGSREPRYNAELLAHYYLDKNRDIEKGLTLLYRIPEELKNAKVYSAIARAELDRERFDRALTAARKSIAIDSLDPLPYFTAGSALIGVDSATAAIEYLAQALNMVPGDPKILNMLGRAYLGKGDSPRAAETFAAGIISDPNFSPSYFNLGYLFLKTGNLDSAHYYAAKGLSIDPENTWGKRLLDMILRGR